MGKKPSQIRKMIGKPSAQVFILGVLESSAGNYVNLKLGQFPKSFDFDKTEQDWKIVPIQVKNH